MIMRKYSEQYITPTVKIIRLYVMRAILTGSPNNPGGSYNRYNFDSCNIPLVYGTQHQRGNDNLECISQYDYMASKMTIPAEDEVNFRFQHLAALVRFTLTIPEGAQFTEFILTAEQSVFPTKQGLDLTGEEPLLYTDKTSDSLKIELSGISLSEAGEIVLYALIPPVNLNGKPLTIVLDTPLLSQAYTAQITGKDFQPGKAYGYTASLTRIFIPQYVDLGLSVKWATCNVGALYPEEYGGIFCWGETEPKTTGFDWPNYKYCTGAYNKLTKYCYSESYSYSYDYKTVDDLITLEAGDDAATANWGEGWRMPTFDEMKELMKQCTWTTSQLNGINGFKVVGKNGNSIFLPAAGEGYMSDISGQGWAGYYWSSTLDTEATAIGPWTNPDVACSLKLDMDQVTKEKSIANRINGRSVRPVCK